MSVHPDDVFKLVQDIRKDLTGIQGKITTLKTMLGELTHNIPSRANEEWRCPRCGVKKGNADRLNDHIELIHS